MVVDSASKGRKRCAGHAGLGVAFLGALTVLAVTASAAPAHAHYRQWGHPYYWGPPTIYYYYAPPAPVYVLPPPAVATTAPPVISPGVSVTPAPAGSVDPQCREYQSITTMRGQQQPAYGTACRQPDGTWRLMD